VESNGQSDQKPAWRSPELIEVGGVADVTASGNTGNVSDNPGAGTWRYGTRIGNSEREVDLERP
jgi:hypothetical protein